MDGMREQAFDNTKDPMLPTMNLLDDLEAAAAGAEKKKEEASAASPPDRTAEVQRVLEASKEEMDPTNLVYLNVGGTCFTGSLTPYRLRT